MINIKTFEQNKTGEGFFKGMDDPYLYPKRAFMKKVCYATGFVYKRRFERTENIFLIGSKSSLEIDSWGGNAGSFNIIINTRSEYVDICFNENNGSLSNNNKKVIDEAKMIVQLMKNYPNWSQYMRCDTHQCANFTTIYAHVWKLNMNNYWEDLLNYLTPDKFRKIISFKQFDL